MPDFEDDIDDNGGADDLRSAIMAAASSSSEPAARETVTEPREDAPAAKPSSDRVRDASGKFAPKSADEPVQGAEAKPPATEPVTPPETAPAATRPAPQSWTTDTKQAWASLPPAIQDQVLKRETETARALEQSSSARRFTSDMEQAMAPHRELLSRVGVPPAAAFARLLEAHTSLEQNAVAGLQQIAASYGLKIVNMQRSGQPGAPQQPAAQQRQAPPPDVRSLVQQELAAEHQRQALASEIASFGQKNPHFESVKPAMARIIQTAASAGEDLSMQDAYDQAIWANPTIRAQLLAEHAAPVAAQVQSEAQRAAAQAQAAADQARVTRARAAGGSVKGAPNGTVAKPGERSLREELLAAQR